MACAASRGSITSPGAFFCSSSCMRLTCVNASSTATTRLGRSKENRGEVEVTARRRAPPNNRMDSCQVAALNTVLGACGRASRARLPRSRARCGWCLCGGRRLQSWPWTGSGPVPLLHCCQDLRRQTGTATACVSVFTRAAKSRVVKCNMLLEKKNVFRHRVVLFNCSQQSDQPKSLKTTFDIQTFL